MKKIVLTMTVIFGLITSCQKENLNNPTNSTNSSINIEEITQQVQNSDDYMSLVREDVNNTEKSILTLFKPFEVNWLNPKVEMKNAGGYSILFNVIDAKNAQRLKGNLIAIYVNNKVKVFYESFHNLDLKLGGDINYYHRTLESGMRVGVSIVEGGIKINGDDIDAPAEAQDGWWECTTECYHMAMQACQTDPECDLYCTFANIWGLCLAATVTSCGVHCSKQNTN